MPLEPVRQTSFNGGELDPRMRGRRDIKTYYNMLETALNVSLPPTGGLEGRPGFAFVDYVRHQLAPVTLTLPMLVTANGGDTTKALAADGDLFETGQPLGALGHIVLVLDFGAPVEVSAIDVLDYAVKEVGATPAPPPFQYPYEPPVSPPEPGPILPYFGPGNGFGTVLP